MYTRNTELRKMHPVEIEILARYLEESDLWKKLIAIIKDEDKQDQMLFTTDHVKIIEGASRLIKKSESEIFLEEWSTIGKKRPTIGILLDYLIKLELFRAADYLAVDILKSSRPERPKFGPAAEVKIDDSILEELNKKAGPRSLLNEQELATYSLRCHGSTKRSLTADRSPNKSDMTSDLIKFSEDSIKIMEFPDIVNKLSMAESQDIPFCVKNKIEETSEDKVTVVSEPVFTSDVEVKSQESTEDKMTDVLESVNASDIAEKSQNNNQDMAKLIQNIIKPNVIPDVVVEYSGSLSDIPIPVCVLEMNSDGQKEKDESQ